MSGSSAPSSHTEPLCQGCGQPFPEGSTAVVTGGDDHENWYWHPECVQP